MKVSSGAIDFGCGYFKQRNTLQRKKEATRKGKHIQAIETDMSKTNFAFAVTSINEFLTNFEINFGYRDELRQFYNSKKSINKTVI